MSAAPAGRPPLALIAIMARNGVIGHGNRMPWHVPEDARHFRRTTAGCPVVMGRKTWDSLPERFRPLPGRRNIVVTRQAGWVAPGAEVCHSLDDALQAAGQDAQARRIFVIGGAQLYALALPLADELVLTEIDADFDGDTRFPAWDRSRFTETARQTLPASAEQPLGLAFVTYRRNATTS